MLRSCIIPEHEFHYIDAQDIDNASIQFYALFEKLFSSKNCTYSIHILASHLLLMRSQGPLTETSAFAFENFYGEMRRSFIPGTVSTLKQIMQKVYLKRSLSFHKCEKSIYYSERDTSLERNSLIYIFSNNVYEMYQIVRMDRNNTNLLHCIVQGKIEIEFDEVRELNWSKVGVFKEGATGNEEVLIQRKNIHGKVLKVSSLLITCPKNVLSEK